MPRWYGVEARAASTAFWRSKLPDLAELLGRHLVVGTDELEDRAGGVTGDGEAAVGRVLGRHDDLPAELYRLGQGGVGVVDCEVHRPVGRHTLGQEAGCVHDAGRHLLTPEKGRVAKLVRVAD